MLNLIKRAWNSKATGWAAVAVIALVVLVVVVAIVLGLMDPVKPGGSPAPRDTQAAPAPTAVPTVDDGTCHVPAGDTSLRPKLPPDLRWEADQGITWPVSASVGPTKIKDGFPVCFARSPLGAAMFGVTVTNEQFRGHTPLELLRFYTVDSPGKEIGLKQGGTGATAAEMAAAGITPAGFITDSFTPDEAHVTLVLTSPKSSTGYMGLPYTFAWVDGDWRLKVLDTGNLFAGSPSAPVKGQFVEWRP